MVEDFIADTVAGAGGSGSTPPQQNNTGNISSPLSNYSAAPTVPSSNASGTLNASMHAPKDKGNFPSNTSSDNSNHHLRILDFDDIEIPFVEAKFVG
ncbi:hypothetical protein RhiirA4_466020 [Rhizophagus irregularis]|uniref:Uncharacterized protein n=1 Tax=Rhizophagus irregularis TaxID=588596 RepID=A0A2I1GT94_9GLOM|nr:hypothetical protein RhiirA4_466020 [Rhizophagus irregularis]